MKFKTKSRKEYEKKLVKYIEDCTLYKKRVLKNIEIVETYHKQGRINKTELDRHKREYLNEKNFESWRNDINRDIDNAKQELKHHHIEIPIMPWMVLAIILTGLFSFGIADYQNQITGYVVSPEKASEFGFNIIDFIKQKLRKEWPKIDANYNIKIKDDKDAEINFRGADIDRVEFKDIQSDGRLTDRKIFFGYDEIEDKDKIYDETPIKQYSIYSSNVKSRGGKITATAEGDTLWKCENWNSIQEKCDDVWKKVKEIEKGEEYSVDIGSENSAFSETDIIILDVQSYPVVGGEWKVRFLTAGTATLKIEASNNTYWDDEAENLDLKFLQLRCGDEPIDYIFENRSVIVDDYSCDEISLERSKVITPGRHHLRFTFGENVEYAHNFASATGILMLRDAGGGQNLNVVVPSGTNITWDTEDREDPEYSHDPDSHVVTINTAGIYRISYGVSIARSTAGTRIEHMANLLVNNQSNSTCWSQAYTRGAEGVIRGHMTADCLLNLSAGDTVTVNAGRTGTNTLATTTVGDMDWLHMQLLNESANVLMIRDVGGGQGMDVKGGQYIDWDTAVTVGGNYSFTATNDNITINEDGLYRVTYGLGVNTGASGTRYAAFSNLEVNNITIPVGWQATYLRGTQGTNDGMLVSDGLIELNSGDILRLRAGRESDTSVAGAVTVANRNWFDIERIEDADTNVIMLTEEGGGQSVNDVTGVDIEFDTTNRSDTFFTKTSATVVRVERAGFYRISYGAYFDRTPIDDRWEHWSSIVINNTNSTVCHSSGYNRGTQGGIDTENSSNFATCIINLTKNDEIELRIGRGSTVNTALTLDVNKTWLHLQALDAINEGPNVTALLNPPNNSIQQNLPIDFNFTVEDDQNRTNCTLYINTSGTFEAFGSELVNVTDDNETNVTISPSDGLFIWNYNCTDEHGVWDMHDDNFTVTIDTSGPVAINPQLNESLINQSRKVLLNVTITDFSGVLYPNVTVTYPNGSTVNYSLADDAGNLYNLTFNDTNQTGVYNFTAFNAIDGFSQYAQTTFTNISFTVQLSPPNAFSLLSPPNDTVSTDLNPNLSWEQTADDFFNNYTLIIDNDSNLLSPQFTYNTTNISNTSNLIPNSLDADTIYYWLVTAYDDFGSATNATTNFTYITDNTNPTITLNLPGNNSFYTTTSVSFNYTPTDANFGNCSLYANFSGPWELNETKSGITSGQDNFFDVTINQDNVYVWNVRCFDRAGNNDYANNNFTVKIDTTDPTINLMNPTNNTLETSTNNILFEYNVSDYMADVSSCKLLLNGTLEGEIDNTITENASQNITAFVENGWVLWSINCTDENGFENQSLEYNLTVNVTFETDPPVITLNYPPAGTYLDMENISFNYTPNDATGITNCSIYINNTINQTDLAVENQQDNFFNISNFSETLYLWNITCFDNNSEAQGWSSIRNYTIDLTDPAVSLHTPSNLTFYTSNSVFFNYTLVDTNIANCSLYGNFSGTWGSVVTNTTPVSNVANNFSTSVNDGYYEWNVRCFDLSGRNVFATVNNTLRVDANIPNLDLNNVSPSSPATYSPSTIYQFNITITEAFIENVTIEHNFSGITANYSVNARTGDVWRYNFTPIGVGSYGYRWYANETLGNLNRSSQFTYIINQASTSVNLLVGGVDGNTSVDEDSAVDLNGSLISPTSGYLELYLNHTRINSGIATNLSNSSTFNTPGVYNISILFNETQNYSGSFETHFLTVNDKTNPNVTLIYPAINETYIGFTTVNFEYNVTDVMNITNCSLLINSTTNTTDYNISRLGTTNTESISFAEGNYTWQVNCYDNSSNFDQTNITFFSIVDSSNITVSLSSQLPSYERGMFANFTTNTFDEFNNSLKTNVTTDIIQNGTPYPWFDTSWGKRIAIYVNETTGINQTQVGVNITIDTQDLVLNGDMQADCDDMRFTDVFNGTLNHYLANGCGTTTTLVTVRMNLTANENGTILFYYDNSGATNVSNLTNTYGPIGETGSVSISNFEFSNVSFANYYSERPLVFATPASQTGDAGDDDSPLAPVITNVSEISFNASICQDNGDATCDTTVSSVTMHWFAFDRNYTNALTHIEVGAATVTSGGATQTITYNRTFLNDPYVFTTPQTYRQNGNVALHAWVGDNTSKTTTNFPIIGCTHQNGNLGDTNSCTAAQPDEYVAYVAIDVQNIEIENMQTGGADISNSVWTAATFSPSITNPRAMVTQNDDDGGEDSQYPWARNVATGGMDFRFCEPDGPDYCDSHTGEVVNWFAIPNGSILARKYPITTPNITIGSEEIFVARNRTETGDSGEITWGWNSSGQPLGNYTAVSTGTRTFFNRGWDGYMFNLTTNLGPPTIDNGTVNATIVNQSHKVLFNITIVDFSNVTAANVSILYPNGSIIVRDLYHVSGANYYYFENDTNTTGVYNFSNVSAMDGYGLINTTILTNSSFNVTLSPPNAFDLTDPTNDTVSTNVTPIMIWEQTVEEHFVNYTLYIDNDSDISSPQFIYNSTNISNTTISINQLDNDTTYYWRVIAYDVFDSSTNSTNDFTYITDNTDPNVTLNEPLNNTFDTDGNVEFNYTPVDLNFGNCSLYANFSGSWGVDQSNTSISSGTFNFFNRAVSDGVYIWNIRCFDRADNNAYGENNLTFTVDTTEPTIRLMGPSNNSVENSTNNVLFTYNVTDAHSEIDNCELIFNDTTEGVPDTTIFEDTTQNFTAFVSNGWVEWQINCTDDRGFENISVLYNLTVNVTNETDPPIVTLFYPGADAYLDIENVSFNYTADDATGITNCSIYINDTLNTTDLNVENTESNFFNLTNFSEEIYSWQVRCFDNSTFAQGNSSIQNFTIDLTDPTVTLHTPTNNSFYTSSNVFFNYTPVDENLANCSLYTNFSGSFVLTKTNTSPNNGTTNNISEFASDGTYLWNIRCFDLANRSTYAAQNLTVRVDANEPTLNNSNADPTSPATYSPSTIYQFNVTVVESFLENVTIEHNFTGTLTNYSVLDRSGNVFFYNYTPLAVGSYAYRWYANDTLGNLNRSAQFTYVVNRADVTLNLTINGTANNATHDEDESVNLTGFMVDPANGFIELLLNGTIINSGNDYISNVTVLNNPGVYNITVRYNETENYSSGNLTYILTIDDNTAPNITLLYPATNNSFIGITSVTFQYNVTDYMVTDNCSIYINGTLNETDNGPVENSTESFEIDFVDGNYTWQIRCYDNSTNLGVSEIITFAIQEATTIKVNTTLNRTQYELGETVYFDVYTDDPFNNSIATNVTTDIINTTSNVSWWNPSWSLRKPLYLNDTTGFNQTLVTVNLTIDTQTIISAGEANSTCEDFRFVTDNGFSLSYYLVSGCNTASTLFQVKLNLSTTENDTIYMYYNNSAATSESSATAIMGPIGETGTMSTEDFNFVNVSFRYKYFQPPIIIATVVTQNGDTGDDDSPLIPTIENITNISANMSICQDNGAATCDATTNIETMHYFVFDVNYSNQLPWLQVGTLVADPDGLATTLNYGKTFTNVPDVYLTSQSYNQGGNLATTMWGEDVGGGKGVSSMPMYGCTHQGQGDTCDASTPDETYGFVAIDPILQNITGFDNGSEDISNSEWTSVSYTSYTTPRIMVSQNDEDGTQDPQYPWARSVGGSSAQIRYCEADTPDYCDTHNAELMIWFTLEDGDITAPKYVLSQPTLVEGIQQKLIDRTTRNDTGDDGYFAQGWDTTGHSIGNYSGVTLATRNLFNNGTNATYFEIVNNLGSPNITLVSPKNHSYQSSSTVDFVFNANSTKDLLNCSIIFNGTINTTRTSFLNETGENRITVSGINDGWYNWSVTCYDSNDKSGNSTFRNVTIDTTSPLPIELVTPINSTYSSNSSPIFTWNQTSDINFANYTIQASLSSSFSSITASNITIPITNTSFDTSITQNNINYWRVVAYDLAGNNYTTSWFRYIHDDVDPVVILLAPISPDNDPDGDVTFVYSGSDTNINNCSLYTNLTGTWAINQTSNLSSGIHTFSLLGLTQNTTFDWNIQCYDLAMNNAFALQNRTITIGEPDANHTNFTIPTYLEINNTFPSLTTPVIDNPIDLLEGTQTEINCTTTVSDNNGVNDLNSTTAVFFHNSSNATASDNTTYHYSDTCSCVNVDSLSQNCTCSFDVWFFANNGNWTCLVNVTDDYNLSATSNNTTIINELNAINLNTTTLDFGSLNTFDTSDDVSFEVTNSGNQDINMTAYTYGAVADDGLVMDCSGGNISYGNERYALTSGVDFSLMTNVSVDSGNPSNLSVDINRTLIESENQTDTVYFKLYIPVGAGGECNGTLVLEAISP